MSGYATLLFDVEASNNELLSFYLPDAEDIEGWWWFDGGIGQAPQNLVTQVLSEVVGAPDLNGERARFGGGSYLITDVMESGAQTIYLVGSSDAALTSSAVQPGFVGNLGLDAGGVNNAGISVFGFTAAESAPAANLLCRVHYDVAGTPTNTPSSNSLAVANISVPQLFSYTVIPGVGRVIRNHTAGTEATYADARARAVNTARPFQIGAFGTFNGVNEQWCMVIAAKVHTTAERAAVVAAIREGMSLLGITV